MVSKDSIDKLKNILPHLFPVKIDVVQHVFNYFESYGNSPGPNVNILIKIGTIVFMGLATYNLFFNLIHTLNNTIWGVEDRSFVRRVIFYIFTIAIVVFSSWIILPYLPYNIWIFYLVAFIGAFLVYRMFPNVSTNSNKKSTWKGSIVGATLFVALLILISILGSIFSEKIIVSYIRNYGKTFYIVFLALAWIWASYVLFLSCAKIGWFVDNPKHNDYKEKNPLDELALNIGRLAIEGYLQLKNYIKFKRYKS